MAWQREGSFQGQGQQIERWPQNSEERESLGRLLGELASQSASLVRDEVALAQQEIREKLKSVESSVIIVAFGSVLGITALLTFCATLILALAQYLKPWQSALIVGLGLTVIAAITVTIGLTQLKHARLKPEQTIRTLEENKEWLREIT